MESLESDVDSYFENTINDLDMVRILHLLQSNTNDKLTSSKHDMIFCRKCGHDNVNYLCLGENCPIVLFCEFCKKEHHSKCNCPHKIILANIFNDKKINKFFEQLNTLRNEIEAKHEQVKGKNADFI